MKCKNYRRHPKLADCLAFLQCAGARRQNDPLDIMNKMINSFCRLASQTKNDPAEIISVSAAVLGRMHREVIFTRHSDLALP